MSDTTRAPRLVPLYAKAALTMRAPRGTDLPASPRTLAEQRIDTDHLAAYQRVCGFRVGDVLPATYLHVLAFPVTVAIMTERRFPLPLVGLVHVHNTVTLHRAVRANERVSFAVHAEGLRPHPSGRQVDLVVGASVDGEPVWTGRSTYLRRGAGSGGERAAQSGSEQVGVRSVVHVPADTGRRYAAVSGDRNPIHLYAVTARAFGFPSAIVHGMWLHARTLAALEGRLPDAYTVDVAFKTPVLLPTTVAIAAGATGTGWALDVRNARTGKPHLTGTVANA